MQQHKMLLENVSISRAMEHCKRGQWSRWTRFCALLAAKLFWKALECRSCNHTVKVAVFGLEIWKFCSDGQWRIFSTQSWENFFLLALKFRNFPKKFAHTCNCSRFNQIWLPNGKFHLDRIFSAESSISLPPRLRPTPLQIKTLIRMCIIEQRHICVHKILKQIALRAH